MLRDAGLQGEHDTLGTFAVFERPQVLWPGWKAPAQARRIELPSGPTQRLWFLVSDGWPAQPWLPLPADRDARWEEVWGQQRDRIAVAADQARAMSGR